MIDAVAPVTFTDPQAAAAVQAYRSHEAGFDPPLSDRVRPTACLERMVAALGVDVGTLTPLAQRTLVWLANTDSTAGLVDLFTAARQRAVEAAGRELRAKMRAAYVAGDYDALEDLMHTRRVDEGATVVKVADLLAGDPGDTVQLVKNGPVWCAVADSYEPQFPNVDGFPTRCGATVVNPQGFGNSTPDCPDCLAAPGGATAKETAPDA